MLGNDLDMPIIYQDLANYTMGPMSLPQGMGSYNTNMLGGTTMAKPLAHDEVDIIKQKDKQDLNVFKKAMLVIGGILLLGAIPVIGKNIKKAGGTWKYIKNLFAKKQPKPPKTQRIKTWFVNQWNKVKNLFKRKKSSQPLSP